MARIDGCYVTRLNAELVASAWNDLATVIRNNNSIPAAMRELMVSEIWHNAYLWRCSNGDYV